MSRNIFRVTEVDTHCLGVDVVEAIDIDGESTAFRDNCGLIDLLGEIDSGACESENARLHIVGNRTFVAKHIVAILLGDFHAVDPHCEIHFGFEILIGVGQRNRVAAVGAIIDVCHNRAGGRDTQWR